MQFDPQELFTDMEKEALRAEHYIKQFFLILGLYQKYPTVQQRAKVLIDVHDGDWKAAFRVMSEARSALARSLEMDCLCIALEAKEQQAITKGE